MVERGALVVDLGVRPEGEEAVGEARRNPKLEAVLGAELYGIVGPDGGRVRAEVDGDVPDGA